MTKSYHEMMNPIRYDSPADQVKSYVDYYSSGTAELNRFSQPEIDPIDIHRQHIEELAEFSRNTLQPISTMPKYFEPDPIIPIDLNPEPILPRRTRLRFPFDDDDNSW